MLDIRWERDGTFCKDFDVFVNKFQSDSIGNLIRAVMETATFIVKKLKRHKTISIHAVMKTATKKLRRLLWLFLFQSMQS